MFGSAVDPVIHPGQLHVLKLLDLGFNQMSGSLPARMSREAWLQSVEMPGIVFVGDIDASLGALLSRIKHCNLNTSKFTCPLPDGMAANCHTVCT